MDSRVTIVLGRELPEIVSAPSPPLAFSIASVNVSLSSS